MQKQSRLVFWLRICRSAGSLWRGLPSNTKQGPVVSWTVKDGYRCDSLKASLRFSVYQLAALQKLNLVSFGNKSDRKQCRLTSGTTAQGTIILSRFGTEKAFQTFVSFLLHNGLGTQAGKVLIHHLRDKETETNRAHVSQSTNTWQSQGCSFRSLTPNLLLFSFPAIWRNVSQKGTCLFFASPFDLQFLIYFLVFVLLGCTFRFISSTAELLLSQRRMTEIKVSVLSILFLTA